jgi:hypothetical protein
VVQSADRVPLLNRRLLVYRTTWKWTWVGHSSGRRGPQQVDFAIRYGMNGQPAPGSKVILRQNFPLGQRQNQLAAYLRATRAPIPNISISTSKTPFRV